MSRETGWQGGILRQQFEFDSERRAIDRFHDLVIQGLEEASAFDALRVVLNLFRLFSHEPTDALFVVALLILVIGVFLAALYYHDD